MLLVLERRFIVMVYKLMSCRRIVIDTIPENFRYSNGLVRLFYFIVQLFIHKYVFFMNAVYHVYTI
jgi:hypothetical protein